MLLNRPMASCSSDIEDVIVGDQFWWRRDDVAVRHRIVLYLFPIAAH